MTQQEYLSANFAEAAPAWLLAYRPGSPSPLQDFLHSRIVFYPGSGFDDHAIEVFGDSHSAHCFVMVDYMVQETDLRIALRDHQIFSGYDVLDIISYSEREVLAAVPCNWHLTQGELRDATERSHEFVQGASYAFLTILRRKSHLDDNQGAERLAVLFLHADGIATYDALFANGNATMLFGLLLQEHGFGGNWDRFGRGGLMEQIAIRAGVYPRVILGEDREYIWSDYVKCDADPTRGGMHCNERYLWVRSANDIEGEPKALRKISRWARHPEFQCSKIIRAFFQVADSNYVTTAYDIRQRCSDLDRHPDTFVEKFDGNWMSLKTNAGNQNGKVFEEDSVQNEDGLVTIWTPVREMLVAHRNDFLA